MIRIIVTLVVVHFALMANASPYTNHVPEEKSYSNQASVSFTLDLPFRLPKNSNNDQLKATVSYEIHTPYQFIRAHQTQNVYSFIYDEIELDSITISHQVEDSFYLSQYRVIAFPNAP